MRSHFEKTVQNFKLKRIEGTPKGHQLTPLSTMFLTQTRGGAIMLFFPILREYIYKADDETETRSTDINISCTTLSHTED